MSSDVSSGVTTGSEPFDVCIAAVLEFLQSKCLFAAERALRTEIEIEVQRGPDLLLSRNLFSSRLELALGAQVPRRPIDPPASEILDMTPMADAVDRSHLDPEESELAAGACAEAVAGLRQSGMGWYERRPRLHLFERSPCTAEEVRSLLGQQRGYRATARHNPSPAAR